MPRETSRCVRKIKESTHTPPDQDRPGQARCRESFGFDLGLGFWVRAFLGVGEKKLETAPPTERGEERRRGKGRDRKGKEKEEKNIVTCH